MKKKLFLLFLFFILFFSCEEERRPGLKVFTFYNGNASLGYRADIFKTTVGQKIVRMTGVRLEISWPHGDDEAAEAELMTASGIYPDIINGHNVTPQFVKAGAFIPLNDLIDQYGPNIKKYYGKNLNQFKDENGIIYYIGWNYEPASIHYPDSAFWLPVDLLRKANWPKVETIDQYFQLIRDYVKQNPEIDGQKTIGFTAITESWRIFTLSLPPAQLMGYPNDGIVYVDQKTLDARLILQAEFTRKYLKMLNSLWADDLIDPAIFTQSYDQYVSKIVSGRVVGFYDQTWQILEAVRLLKEKGRSERLPIPFPVLFEGVSRERYNFVKALASRNGVGISVDCKDPSGVMKFWNRMLEEDIQILNYWGIKDKDYSIIDGKMVKSEKQLSSIAYSHEGISLFIYGFPQVDRTGFFSDGNPVDPIHLPAWLSFDYNDVQKEVLSQYGVQSFRDFFAPSYKSPYGYGWSIILPQEGKIPEAADKIDELRRKFYYQLIVTKPDTFEALWQEFQGELKKIDVQPFLDYLSALYKRRAAGEWR